MAEFKNFTELDFENIKTSLRSYLERQDEFKDYNFDGSAINTLLNVFSYVTQYNAFYLNMHSSERFLTTAQKRSNVVNLARNLGYVSRSAKPSRSFLDVSFRAIDSTINSFTIPSNTIFKAKNSEGDTVSFLVENDVTIKKRSGDQEFVLKRIEEFDEFGEPTGVLLNEGLAVVELKKLNFTTQLKEGDSGFTIPNSGVDTDKIKVTVDGVLYTQISDSKLESFVTLTSESTVFFVEEVEGEKHRVFFGDNIIGIRPLTSSIIEVEYYITSGAVANGSQNFELESEVPGMNTSSFSITQQRVSGGGQNIETTESIRKNAPLFFNRQNRCVTPEDYESIVYDIYPEAVDVVAWGGEDNDKMGEEEKLGYVFISIIRELFDETNTVPIADKRFIEHEIRTKYGTATIFPTIVDPLYTFVTIKSIVNYDSRQVNPGSPQIKTDAIKIIKDFAANNFAKFASTLRSSKLFTEIDRTHSSVLSNDTSIMLYSERTSIEELIEIQKNKSNFILNLPVGQPVKQFKFFDFGVPLKRDTLSSNFFKYVDGESILVTSYVSNGTNIITANVSNTSNITVGNSISVLKTEGLVQSKLKGTWSIISKTTNTITFSISENIPAGTYQIGIGVAVKNAIFYDGSGTIISGTDARNLTYLKENELIGTFDLMTTNSLGQPVLLKSNVANIDYSTGLIDFNTIDIPTIGVIGNFDFFRVDFSNVELEIRIFSEPASKDITLINNRIAILRDEDISVTVVDVST